MARYDFGGTLADFVISTRRLGGIDVLGLASAILTFWSAQTGGTQYTDLRLNGSATSSISVGTDGQVPTFQGPDTVTAMWADGGSGRVRIVAQGIPGPAGPGATNSDIAGYVTGTGSTQSALDARYAGKFAIDARAVGIKFDGTTDDTAAWQAAINTIAAAAVPTKGRGYIVCPEGLSIISEPLAGIPDGLAIVGAGRRLTTIRYTGTGGGAVFGINAFSTNPSPDYWTSGGNLQLGFTMERMSLFNGSPADPLALEGSRVGVGVQDNGVGSLRLREVQIRGFQYGVAAPYGSDFSSFNDVDLWYNDVGMYLGPGAEQIHMEGIQFFRNREGLVLDASPHGVSTACFWIDSTVADIVFERKAGGTRFGLAAAAASLHNCSWTFNSPWFESAAGGSTRIPPQHVLIDSDDTVNQNPRGVTIRDAYLVSGGTPSSTNVFWRAKAGNAFLLDGILILGSQIKYVIEQQQGSTRFMMRDKRDAPGNQTGTQNFLWNTSTGFSQTCIYEDNRSSFSRQARDVADPLYRTRTINDSNDRWQVLADGKQMFGDGTITPGDTKLYRSAAGVLRTDTAFQAAGFRSSFAFKTANYTATATDAIINASGTITITLPSATTIGFGREYTIKNSGAGTVTVGSTAGTIDGSATDTIAAGASRRYVSDGSVWWKL